MIIKKKKGYFFLIDGVFAIIILSIGFLVISSQKPHQQSEISFATTGDNIMDLFSNINLNEICNGCNCNNNYLKSLCQNNKIRNFNQSLLDYFGELYNTSKFPPSSLYYTSPNNAKELFMSLDTDNSLLRNDLFGYEFYIIEKTTTTEIKNTIYSNSLNPDNEKQKSKELISSKRLIIGYYNTTDEVIFWGPYLIVLDVWKK